MANAWIARTAPAMKAEALARARGFAFYGAGLGRDERDLIWWFTEAHGAIGDVQAVNFAPLEMMTAREATPETEAEMYGRRVRVWVAPVMGVEAEDRDHPKYAACARARPIVEALGRLDSATRGVLAAAFTRSKAHAHGEWLGHDVAGLLGSAEHIDAMSEKGTIEDARVMAREVIDKALELYRIAKGRESW